MSQIDRTGTFRGYPIDSGMGETKNGFPQWIAQLQGAEYYDEETQQWVDWSQYDETEITGYFVLFGSDGKPTLTAKQIQKALGWSGESFSELDADFSQTMVQFRVEQSTYQGETRLKVTWVDHADAEPGRTIQKLEAGDIKKLDSKYAAALKNLSGGSKPKSVPAKPATPKPTPAVDKEAVKAAMKAKATEKKARGAAAEAKAAGKKKPPKPVAPQPVSEPETTGETCTLNEAWEAVYSAKPDSIADDALGNVWLATIDKYGDQDTLTGDEWVKVRDEVVAEINP